MNAYDDVLLVLQLYCFLFFLVTDFVLDLNELKHEDLENHASLNHNSSFKNDQQFEVGFYPKKEKTDEILEEETRGVDFKGNIRYFCPKCNVSKIDYYLD